MALTERETLASVNHNLVANTMEVKWLDEILRDGDVISSIPHRCAYGVGQKDQFVADVGPESAKYIAMAGW